LNEQTNFLIAFFGLNHPLIKGPEGGIWWRYDSTLSKVRVRSLALLSLKIGNRSYFFNNVDFLIKNNKMVYIVGEDKVK
jgi:hypothetical protein